MAEGFALFSLAGAVAISAAGLGLVGVRLLLTRGKSNYLDQVLAGYVSQRIRPTRQLAKLNEQTTESLAAASITLTARAWYGILGAAALTALPLFVWITGNLASGIIAALLAPSYLQFGFLPGKAKKAAAAFDASLPQLLEGMAASLRAGLTVEQSVVSLGERRNKYVSRLVDRMLSEVNFGSTLNAALNRLALRIKSSDLAWLAKVLEIHQQTGGPLAPMVSNLAAAMRTRALLHSETEIASAETRLSGKVLMAFPLVISAALMVFNPEYLAFFLAPGLGPWMLLGALTLMAVGWFWTRKLTSTKASKSKALEQSLPDTMDLLTLCLQAGLPVVTAIQLVAEANLNPASQAMTQVAIGVENGALLEQQLRLFAASHESANVDAFASLLIQANQLGTELSGQLSQLAESMRVEQSSKARAKGQRLGVTMLAPMMLCMMPATFTIVVGPALVQLVKAMSLL